MNGSARGFRLDHTWQFATTGKAGAWAVRTLLQHELQHGSPTNAFTSSTSGVASTTWSPCPLGGTGTIQHIVTESVAL